MKPVRPMILQLVKLSASEAHRGSSRKSSSPMRPVARKPAAESGLPHRRRRRARATLAGDEMPPRAAVLPWGVEKLFIRRPEMPVARRSGEGREAIASRPAECYCDESLLMDASVSAPVCLPERASGSYCSNRLLTAFLLGVVT